jgi:mRNA-degrading endonuclease toxin of MazEF toxin-antitoxin module
MSAKRAARGTTAGVPGEVSWRLARDSVAVCHQVTTLDREKLTKKLGTLTYRELTQVEVGLRASLDIG